MAPTDFITAPTVDAMALTMTIERDLVEGDLVALAASPPLSEAPPLKSIRAIHHRQAQLVAEGFSLKAISMMIGTTPQRLGQLIKDPSFADLVALYRAQGVDAHIDDKTRIEGKLLDTAELALDELHLRLEGGRPGLPGLEVEELRRIAEMGLDRTLAPPKSTQTAPTVPANITLNFGGAVASSKVIEANLEPQGPKALKDSQGGER